MDALLSEEAVENLVTQFSSALDFYRELVQNSIDAGTPSVEVWLEFEPSPDRPGNGVISIHVDDFGDGMTEAIIDSQLTQLFASTKDNDLTKIGKFGIGFVSVFAMKPKGVLVKTGRDGEYWEVFFHEDRTFSKALLDSPVEGTQLTLFLEGDRGDYDDLVDKSRATLKKWCSHSDTEITFEDRSAVDSQGEVERINEPFGVDGECLVRVEHPGTHLALAFTRTPTYGYYNKGLALAVTTSTDEALEGRADRFRYIAVKIKSRYLEHTLSRETVMRDDNYEKAMFLLEEAADIDLRGKLFDELEAVCAQPDWDFREVDRYRALMTFLAGEPSALLPAMAQRGVLRTVDGRQATLESAERAMASDGRVLVAEAPSRMTALLSQNGTPVFRRHGSRSEGDPVEDVILGFLDARHRLGLTGFVQRVFKLRGNEQYGTIAHPAAITVAVSVEPTPPPQVRELILAAGDALKAADVGYRELRCGSFEGTTDSSRLFVLGPKISQLMMLPPAAIYVRGFLERPAAVVNLYHPYLRWLVELRRSQPAIAAYCLAKSLVLEEERDLEQDQRLMVAAQQGAR